MHVHSGAGPGTSKVLRISLFVTLAYIALLVMAGIRAHSLALLSEAGHNLSDFLALLLSLVAVYLQSRPPSATKTYGYHRAGVLAALINAGSLVVISFFIFYEAFRRVQNPQPVHAGLMMWVAGAGVVMNGIIALLLYRSGGDINIRSALLHEVGDTLDRLRPLIRHRRPDRLVFGRHSARDHEHPARGHAARHETRSPRSRHPQGRGRQ